MDFEVEFGLEFEFEIEIEADLDRGSAWLGGDAIKTTSSVQSRPCL